MNRGKSKTSFAGSQFECRRHGVRSDRNEAWQRRRFNCGPEVTEGISRSEKTGCEEEALTRFNEVSQQPVEQAGEVAFSLLGFRDVGCGQCDEHGLLSLGRSASTRALASDFLFLHVKKYIRFSLTVNNIVYTYSRMANNRISKAKRVYILAALSEGTPINAVCRMFKVGKHGVLRVIAETGEALGNYMDRNFRDLPCARIEMDEQWQYVGRHGQRMMKKENGKGDYWLWACIDADTKLVIAHAIDRRKWNAAEYFVADVAARVRHPVQITTDALASYGRAIKFYFGEGCSYATETKNFIDWPQSEAQAQRKNGVPKIASAERKAVLGNPDLGIATTSHVERLFLSMRQELTRFTRRTLGYSKDLRMHTLATALHIGLYNLVRRHTTLGTTPAVAAGVEQERWSLETVVDVTERYWQPKIEAAAAKKAQLKRLAEDDLFLRALNAL